VKVQRHSRLAALVCLPSLLFLHGCDNPQQQAKAELPPAAVTVAPVAEDKITPTVTFTGRVQAQDKVDLRARIDGFLEKRLFNEGQDVKKGDLLFVIEQAPYKSAIAEIKADIQKAEAALTLANIEVKRATELVAKEVGTQKRLDDVTMQQARARGEIARLKASLEKAELNLSYTEIRAPLAGRIGRATVSVGNYVGPSSEPLATIVKLSEIGVVGPSSSARAARSISRSRDHAMLLTVSIDGTPMPVVTAFAPPPIARCHLAPALQERMGVSYKARRKRSCPAEIRKSLTCSSHA